ncbi:DMT family transporter [Teichococcus deserti]|uniref:DMT family transporter n=1 Tax=Teichococcus deserti TaxID=1817963 RepID=UPI0009F9134F|nr:DMT family transporter [Pseudoroseomonas deserti]
MTRCAPATARAPGCIWRASSASWRARSPTISIDAAAAGRRIGIACLVFTATGWGMTWPVLKTVMQELPALTARGLGGVIATLGLALAALALRQPLSVPRSERPALLLAALLNYAAWMGFSTLGLRILSAGEGALVAYTMPVWAALLAWPVLGERPTLARLAALGMGMAGVAVLMSGQSLSAGLEKLPGVLLVLAAALCFALGAVLSKRRPLVLHPLTSVVWQVGIGSLPILAGAALLERPDWGQVSALSWSGVAYMGAVPLSLCYLTWFAALRRLPAGTAAMGTLLTPIVGMLASAALLGEPLGWRQATALTLTLGGVVLALRG